MRFTHLSFLSAGLLALTSLSTSAADYQQEYDKKIKASQDVGVLGDGIAGDRVNFFTGATSFRATDVSVPTNALPVSVSRSIEVEYDRQKAETKGTPASGVPVILATTLRAFADWDLDVPHISTTMTQSAGWIVDSTTPLNRCSVIGQVNAAGTAATGAPPMGTGSKGWTFDPGTYWSGYTLHTAGGDQSMLLASLPNSERPAAGGSFHWTTNQDWWFSCLSATANSAGGEGYVAHAPDGSQYTFNWLSKRNVSSITDSYDVDPMGGGVSRSSYLFRAEYLMLPTRIEDRFGNWKSYSWSSDAFARLLSVSAGPVGSTTPEQTITLAYNAEGYVSSVTDGSRTWVYTYSGATLTQVTLPDSSKWQYELASLGGLEPARPKCDVQDPYAQENYWTCFGGGEVQPAPVDAAITHPSGARIDFKFDYHYHHSTSGIYPMGITQKTISGPGLATGTWKYVFMPTRADTIVACRDQGVCPQKIVTDQVNPDNSITRRIFGNGLGEEDTMLLSELQGSTTANGGGSPAITTSARWGTDVLDDVSPVSGTVPTFYSEFDYRYVPSTQSVPYVVRVGVNPLISVYSEVQIYATERRLPLQIRNRVQQGVAFVTQTNAFDAYARPASVTRSSTGGAGGNFSRTETTTYADNTAKWVVGQVLTVTDSSKPSVPASKTDYDPTTAMPIRTYSFDVLQQSLAYNANGTLATVTDGRNNVTSVSNWYRGIPRLINYPDSTSESATVDALGNLLSTTDQLNSATSYSYDSLGRLSGITYPTGDSSTWSPTTRIFAPVTSTEYGLPAGHWKQTVTTGSERHTTFYDAQWRPVITLDESTGTLPFASFTVRRYDALGRNVFTSYPVASLTSVNDALDGTTTSYDALGRVTQVSQTAEAALGGAVTSRTEYLTGFQTRTINPRNQSTTTSYQLFDSPSTDAPVAISLPEGVTTTIVRQPGLGKPVSVTRSGTYGGSAISATRSYVYDLNERLCKTINPESGAAVVDYDAAGNLAWSAHGTTLIGSTCDSGSVVAGDKTVRTYDSMNRVTAVSTPGGTADLTSTYFADGLVNTLTAANPGNNNVITAYSYNKRRLLTAESSTNGNSFLTLGYGYKGNGYLKDIAYPDGEIVSFNPDALGRASLITSSTGVTYASGIKYYANGAIQEFFYGSNTNPSAIKHTMTQNARRLPINSRDASGTVVALDDSYSFDANGNVTGITDLAQGGLTSRAMTYDGLDRMLTATSNSQWGAGTYAYDPLDNLRSTDVVKGGVYSRQYRYNYDAITQRLTDIKNPAGANQQTFSHDARGNTIVKSGLPYVFDSANRLNQAPGFQTYRYDGMGRRVQTTDADGTLMYWIYSQSGQVLHTAEGRRSRSINYIYLGNTQVATRTVAWAPVNTVTIRNQHTDALGSPVATTAPDTGAVLRRISYTPWGETYGTTVDGSGYTGHVMDSATGLTYMQQRYYDPQIGRLLSADPAIADPQNGSNFSPYWYANNNPYRFTDPDGRVAMGGGSNMGPQNFGISMGFEMSSTLYQPVGGGRTLGFRVSETERAMVKSGDLRGFWESRTVRGDPWGPTGLGIWGSASPLATPVHILEGLATTNLLMAAMYKRDGNYLPHLRQTGLNRYGKELREIGVALAAKHVDMVTQNGGRAVGLDQAEAYHHAVFSDFQLPMSAYGGTIYGLPSWFINSVFDYCVNGCKNTHE